MYNNINLKKLKKISKLHGIKNYSRLKKSEIIKNLKETISAKRLQRLWRIYKKINQQLCPITLENIKYPYFAYRKNIFY